MKFYYLGTAAAEGFPAVFCNCQYCQNAREKGGKNIRTRSQALVDGDLLIDYPPDAYMHALTGKFRFDKVKSLLFTHSHCDHCYAYDLKLRYGAFAHNPEAEVLQVYCGKGVQDLFIREFGSLDFLGVEIHLIKAFEPFQTGAYTVTPLPARHKWDEDAYIFILEKDGKRILYANDTGYFYDETFAYIRDKGLYFDFVSYDCTNVEIPIEDNKEHMGFPNIVRVSERLKAMGAIDKNTLQYVTHFSHNGNPDHERLEAIALPLGFKVAYDGLLVEI